MKTFQDLSIRGKLIAMMLAVTIIALGCGFALVIIADITSFKRDMVDRTTTTARGIGDYCVTPLAFDDREGAAGMLTKLNAIPSITNAAVYDAEGNLFAALDPEAVPVAHGAREAVSEFQRDRLLIHEPIVYEGDHYGVIYLQASTDSLHEKIVRRVLYMLVVMVALIVVAVLLAVRFERVISGPILDLAGVVRRIAAENTYSVRVQKTGDDEIGALYDGFNNMLQQLNDRESERDRAEAALRENERHLEELVRQRTSELTDANEQLTQEIQERVQTERELKQIQGQLVQSAKMASLGMLVAGVAHEINTPVGAISSSYDTLVRAIERLKSMVDASESGESEQHRKTARMFKVIEDANRVIASGTARVTDIVQRLRSFARLDEAEFETVDLHEGIEDTLLLVHHELKNKAVVERRYGDLPPISCNPRQLNQVYVNLLINAVQAIENKGTITITTFCEGDNVHVQISDTGMGIPEESLQKIFDPGYTTKGVGVGTGLGLSICYQILETHEGDILVDSEVGKGTTFTLVVPMTLTESEYKARTSSAD